jgi:hypothetical protein
MKLNFIHILAHLGFVGVYPIYWNNESKACHKCTYSKYSCKRLSRTKRKYNLDETLIKSRTNSCPNYIKESNQHRIDSKDLSHYKKLIKPKAINEITNPQDSKVPTNKQNPHTFHDGTKYQKEKVCLPKTNT